MLCKNIFLKEWILENQSKEWIRDHFWSYWGQWKLMMEKQRLPEEEEEAQDILRLRDLREQVRVLPLIKKMKKYPKKYPPEALEDVRRRRQAFLQQIHLLVGDRSSAPRRKLAIISRCMCDDCEGHVREDGRCALCGRLSCLECGMEKEEAHRCDPVQRDSFRAIQRETKPCPGCSSRVFFLGGCDQMWCTMCHTLFQWSTGQRVEEHIHNPHYYEWMARQQKTMVAVPIEMNGNDIPPYHSYSNFLYQHNLDHAMFSNLHRQILHVRYTVLPRLQPHIPEDKSLRLQYLTGDLTCEQWVNLLIYREKKRLKWTSLYQLAQAGLAAMRDFVRLSIIRPEEPPTREDVTKFVEFIQDRIDTILRCYGGNQSHPSLEWIYKLIL
jgi:hypothetical protein